MAWLGGGKGELDPPNPGQQGREIGSVVDQMGTAWFSCRLNGCSDPASWARAIGTIQSHGGGQWAAQLEPSPMGRGGSWGLNLGLQGKGERNSAMQGGRGKGGMAWPQQPHREKGARPGSNWVCGAWEFSRKDGAYINSHCSSIAVFPDSWGALRAMSGSMGCI